MKEGRKPEYPEKTPGDELQKRRGGNQCTSEKPDHKLAHSHPRKHTC